jgi:hypothetical protein
MALSRAAGLPAPAAGRDPYSIARQEGCTSPRLQTLVISVILYSGRVHRCDLLPDTIARLRVTAHRRCEGDGDIGAARVLRQSERPAHQKMAARPPPADADRQL